VYLFGEHAVVYGEPAVPCAIERRAQVTVEERDEGVRVNLQDLTIDGFTVEYDSSDDDRPDVDVSDSLVDAGMGYVNEAIEQARSAADDARTRASTSPSKVTSGSARAWARRRPSL